MDLTRFSSTDLISLDLKGTTKKEVFRELVEIMAKSTLIIDKEEVLEALTQRESVASTGIGFGIGLPHAKTDAAKGIILAYGKSVKGIEYNAFDNRPVHSIFVVVAPEDSITSHLAILAKLSLLLKEKESREKLMEVIYPHEVLDILRGE